jgi:superfamily II DNA helicase RecQ
MQVKLFQVRLSDEHLSKDQDILNNFMENVSIKKTSTQFINSEPVFWSVVLYYEEANPGKAANKTHSQTILNESRNTELPPVGKNKQQEPFSVVEGTPLSSEQQIRLDALKQWRTKAANELKLPGYVVATNADLLSVVKANPATREELSKIKGFGPKKVEKYGPGILLILEAFPVQL